MRKSVMWVTRGYILGLDLLLNHLTGMSLEVNIFFSLLVSIIFFKQIDKAIMWWKDTLHIGETNE